jgi:hypothetical protein
MAEPTSPPDAQPGRYGAGYGEQQPAETPEPPPALESARDAPAGLEPRDAGLDPDAQPPADSDGAPVVFTPDDVSARPPDHPPTESAPQSEKAALIFERS